MSTKSPTEIKGSGIRLQCPLGSQVFSSIDPSAIEQLQTFITTHDSESGKWTCVLHGLTKWPPEFRWAALAILSQLKDRLKVVAKNAEPKKLFNYICSLIGKHQDVDAQGAIYQAACEAAAHCHADHVASAVSAIRKAYRDAQLDAPAKSTLTADIDALIGSDNREDHVGAQTIAQEFLGSLTPADSNDGDIPWLAYHRNEWYQYSSGWTKLQPSDLSRQIVAFAQKRKLKGGITTKLLQDIILNLSGLCSTFPWEMEMPIWLSDDGTFTESPYIAVGNGLLNIRRAIGAAKLPKLYATTPRHFATAKLGFDYDSQKKCLKWIETLRQVFSSTGPGDNRIKVFQEFCGWILLTRGLRLEKLLVMFGAGANGKSTLLAVLRQVLGASNVSSVPIDKLGSEFRAVEIAGKLANIVADMTSIAVVDEGMVKRFTSGEPMQVNRKYLSPITIEPYAKFIVAANSLPMMHDYTDGMFRRIICMPFLRQFKENEQNVHLVEELMAELPGIANWMLQGLIRLYREKSFTHCEVCEAARQQHRLDSDPVRQFVTEECALAPDRSVSDRALFNAFQNWCRQNNQRSVKSSEFRNRVLALTGVKLCRRGPRSATRLRCYEGIGLAQA